MIKALNGHNNKALLKWCLSFLIPLFFCSCAGTQNDLQPVSEISLQYSHPDSENHLQKIKQLQTELSALSNNIDVLEARELAETSINYSLFLADEYRLVRPPYLHNILILVGFKDRGLCYHWTEDLMKRLKSLELKSFGLHEGVAHKGSDLREHNSVVVTAKGQDFSEGIVLDPWRDSGDLYWALVKTDRYPWEERQ